MNNEVTNRTARIFFIFLVMAAVFITGCKGKINLKSPADGAEENKDEGKQIDSNNKTENEMNETNKTYGKIKINEGNTYQTIESFGASGAWWSQYVGSWDKPYGDQTVPVRDAIATLLYSREDGIGLSGYRYNLGAGSYHSGKGIFWNPNRRAQSFEKKAGEYDFTRDEHAVWFLKKVVELGAEEITLFCNSPLERLTVNGLAHMSGKNEVNLLPENYKAFAAYVLDVTEHFVKEGIPVKFISPINEPQWDWLEGQEGIHYEPKEVVEILMYL